ncbi:hypothetical protein MRB53_037294 [Persea americana]|nr:hypothetical protein MRB53_037294 [Persea americana]
MTSDASRHPSDRGHRGAATIHAVWIWMRHARLAREAKLIQTTTSAATSPYRRIGAFTSRCRAFGVFVGRCGQEVVVCSEALTCRAMPLIPGAFSEGL